jgi:DNA polymerase I-like protein with 3'-5' exonuclease and polymerase domains
MLIKIDSAQLEWRTAVWLSGDEVGIKEINSGADIHALNQGAFNLPTRLISKKYLFSTIFRASGWSFANNPEFNHVSTDSDYWDDVAVKFYSKYKGLDAWHHRLAKMCAEHTPIVSPFGREWLVLPKDGKLPWTVFTNYPVQGTGADLMTIARVSLWNRLKAHGMRFLVVSTVHDDIKVDATDDEVERVADIALQVFKDIPMNVKKLFNVDLPIPFPGEVSIGRDLKNMENYK